MRHFREMYQGGVRGRFYCGWRGKEERSNAGDTVASEERVSGSVWLMIHVRHDTCCTCHVFGVRCEDRLNRTDRRRQSPRCNFTERHRGKFYLSRRRPPRGFLPRKSKRLRRANARQHPANQRDNIATRPCTGTCLCDDCLSCAHNKKTRSFSATYSHTTMLSAILRTYTLFFSL